MEPRDPKWRIALLAIVIVFAAGAIAIFSSRFLIAILAFQRTAIPLLLALVGGLASLGVGRGARRLAGRLLGREPESVSSTRLLAEDLVVGFPLFGSIAFLAGLASTGTAMMSGLLFAAGAGGLLVLLGGATGARSRGPAAFDYAPAATVLLGLAFAIALVHALLPPVTLDELAYHLAVPKIWALESRVVELPLISHSYFPFGSGSAALPLLAIAGGSGAIAAHLLHLLIAIATASIVFDILRQWHLASALLIVAALATTPALLLTSGWAWADVPLLGVCLVLFVAVADRRDGATVAAAIAAGLAIKYTFIPFAAIVVGTAIVVRREERRRLLAASLIGAVGGSLFFIRNLILTGNPLAPFFSPLAPEVSRFRSGAGFADLVAGYLFHGRFLDEALGAAALVGLAAAILLASSLPSRFERVALLLLVVALVALVILAPSSRILLPYLIVPALFGLGAAFHAADRAPRILRQLLAGALVVATTIQLLLVAFYTSTLDPLEVVTGAVEEEVWLRRTRAGYEDVAWLNGELPPGSRTLVVGYHELFWFERKVRGAGNFDGERMAAFLAAPTPEALQAKLAEGGFTHLALFKPGIVPAGAPRDAKSAERTTPLPPETVLNIEHAFDDSAQSPSGRMFLYEVR